MKKGFKRLATLTIVGSILFSNALADSWYVITGNDVNVRSSPTRNAENILCRLNRNDVVDYIEKEDEWIFVRYKDTYGYVFQDYVQKVSTPDYAIGGAIANTSVHLRIGPSTAYSSITVLHKGTFVSVLQREGNWLLVSYNGMTGYTFAEFWDYIPMEGIVLGSYTTSFSTNQKGRAYNIEKAAKLIDGIVVEPDETFSLLQAIGPITQEYGYQEAPEFKTTSHGVETVMGYGGGVCQIATTLYQSVCNTYTYYSNLKITERHRHSKQVTYVPEGQDATISWNAGQDFQFVNNNTYSIKIVAFVKRGLLTCIIVKI